ncbi:MAG: spondin domain-containing protein [Acidobacteriota bacterium]
MRVSSISPFSRILVTALITFTLSVPATAQDTDAQCMLQFDATWSAQTHPIDFPEGAHFSPLIGATHNDTAVFWQSGELATPGIQQVAETGQTGMFTSEINAVIGMGNAESVINGGAAGAPGMTQANFDVSLDHPRITVVTMIAPSPDWFVGTNGLNLFENGSWRETTVFDLLPYDAGTDSGATFNSPDQPTVPPEPIFRISEDPLPNDVPLGTYTIACTSNLLFMDDFESGDLSVWASSR